MTVRVETSPEPIDSLKSSEPMTDRIRRYASVPAEEEKLIMFHGYADTSISPFGSIAFYRDLLAIGKQASLEPQQNVALFMVPGMGHCGGGIAPTQFDSLSALLDWTENFRFPKSNHCGQRRRPTILAAPLPFSKDSEAVRPISPPGEQLDVQA